MIRSPFAPRNGFGQILNGQNANPLGRGHIDTQNAGVTQPGNPNSGFGLGGGRNIGSTPTPGNPANRGSVPRPPNTANSPTQNIPGGSGNGFSSMSGTLINAAQTNPGRWMGAPMGGTAINRNPSMFSRTSSDFNEYPTDPGPIIDQTPSTPPTPPEYRTEPTNPPWAPPIPKSPTGTTPPNNPPGDVGHNGIFNNQNREQWRDSWMGQGPMTPQQMDAWMAANGATRRGDNGTFRTPFGEDLDLGYAYKGGGLTTPSWTGLGGSGGISTMGGGGIGDQTIDPQFLAGIQALIDKLAFSSSGGRSINPNQNAYTQNMFQGNPPIDMNTGGNNNLYPWLR